MKSSETVASFFVVKYRQKRRVIEMGDPIVNEIMRLYNCCEKRARDIMDELNIHAESDLEAHISFLASSIERKSKEAQNV